MTFMTRVKFVSTYPGIKQKLPLIIKRVQKLSEEIRLKSDCQRRQKNPDTKRLEKSTFGSEGRNIPCTLRLASVSHIR